MKIRFYLILLMIIVLLSGCYVPASSVYSFKSKHDNSIWVNGKQLIKLADLDVEVIVNYDRTKHGVAIFDVAIANNSEDIVLVDPVEFYCIINNKLNEKITVKANNPEKVLLNIDKSIEKTYAKNRADGQTELMFSMFDIIEEIHYLKQSDEGKDKRWKERKERRESSSEIELRQMTTIEKLNRDRDTIEHQALRKTTMFPGQKIGGKVYFKVRNNLNKLVIHFPIDGRDLVLEYEIIPI